MLSNSLSEERVISKSEVATGEHTFQAIIITIERNENPGSHQLFIGRTRINFSVYVNLKKKTNESPLEKRRKTPNEATNCGCSSPRKDYGGITAVWRFLYIILVQSRTDAKTTKECTCPGSRDENNKWWWESSREGQLVTGGLYRWYNC